MKIQKLYSTRHATGGTLAALLALAVLPVVAAPPANDAFADAIAITGLPSSTTGTNIEATDEVDETGNGVSVWWKWTAPSSGSVTFDTVGSVFDTVLRVYTGTSLLDLALVASNDDSGDFGTSRVTFVAVAAVTYYIQVDGFDDTETGDIQLNWAEVPPGEIAIFKKTSTTTYLEHSVDETVPQIPGSFTEKYTGTSYVIYDSENDRTAEVVYGTSRYNGVTTKWYSVDSDPSFPFDIIPGRLAGTKFWLSASSFHFASQEPPSSPSLGSGSLSGYSDAVRGLATALLLAPGQSIIVPRALTGFSRSSDHTLGWAQDTDELGAPVGDPYAFRAFSRSTESSGFTLQVPLTKSANLADNDYPMATLENGIARVQALLESLGYVEEDNS